MKKPKSPRDGKVRYRPEYLHYTTEHGPAVLVVRTISAVEMIPSRKDMTDTTRYCVAIAHGSGVLAYGDFTQEQATAVVRHLISSLHDPMRLGTAMDLDMLAKMAVSNFPESQVVRPALVVP